MLAEWPPRAGGGLRWKGKEDVQGRDSRYAGGTAMVSCVWGGGGFCSPSDDACAVGASHGRLFSYRVEAVALATTTSSTLLRLALREAGRAGWRDECRVLSARSSSVVVSSRMEDEVAGPAAIVSPAS